MTSLSSNIYATYGGVKDTSPFGTYNLLGGYKNDSVMTLPSNPYRAIINYNAATTAQTLGARFIQLNNSFAGPSLLNYLSGTMVELINASGGANLVFDSPTNYVNYILSQAGQAPLNNSLSVGDIISFTISNVSGQSITPTTGSNNITLTGTVNAALANNTAHLVNILVTATGANPTVLVRGTRLV